MSVVRPIHVLVVDDEPYLCDLSKEYLERSKDIEVEIALSAPKARTILGQRHFDAIVSDYQMPGEDGIKFLKSLRARGDKIPFILFTGKGREEAVIEALNNGADSYLQKGGKPESQYVELEHRIRAVVRQRRGEEAIRESEERNRLLLNSMAEAMYGLDMDGRCTFCNESCLRLLRYARPEELLGKNMHRQIHAKHADGTAFPEEICRIFQAFNKGEGTHVDDEVFWRSDGTCFPAEYWSYPQYHDGVVVGAVVTFLDITERRRAEEALRESEHRFALAINGTGAGLWDWDMVGNKVVYSDQWKRMLGYGPHEVKDSFSGWKDLWHPDDSKDIEKALDDYLTGRTDHYDIVHRLRHKNGSWRWILTRGDIVKDAGGKPVRWVGTNIDITERKRAEEAIREINVRFDQLARESGTVPWEVDADGLFTYVSNISETVLGYRPEELVGKISFYDLLYAKERDVIKKEAMALFTRGERFADLEFSLPSKTGDLVWVSITGIPLLNTDGTLRGYQGSITDITERKLVNMALVESESFNRGLVDNLPEYIVIYGLDGLILYANADSAKVLGYDPKEVVGAQLLSYVAEESRDHMIAMMKARIHGEPVPSYEMDIVTRDGQRKSVMVKGSPIQYHGRPAFIVVLNDISDRKKMENALRSKEEELRLITDHIGENVLLLDMGMKIQWVSPSTVRSRGFTFDELANMPVEQQLPPESLDRLLSAASRLLTPENLDDPEKKVVFTDVLEFFKKDGGTVWAEVVINLIRDELGRPSGLLAVGRDVTDRIRSKEAMRSSGIGLWDWNVQTGETHFDEYWVEIIGYDLAELAPFNIDTWMGMIHPDDLERSKGEIARYFACDIPSFEVETRLKCKDGHWAWVLVRGSVLGRDAEGIPIIMSGTLLDISKRKLDEEQIAQAKDLLQRAVKGSGVGLWDWNVQTGETVFNERWAEILGYTLLELSPISIATWERLVHPDDLERSNELLARHFVHESEFYECEARMRHKDGRWIWVLDRGKVSAWNAEGRPTHMSGTHLDITERKAREEALRESGERYRLLLENSHDIIYTITPDGTFTFVSPSWTTLLGHPVDEVVGRPFQQFVHADDLAECMAFLRRTAEMGRRQSDFEYRVRHADGSWRWHTSNVIPILDGAGNFIGLEGNARDVTDMHDNAERAREPIVRSQEKE